MAVEYQVIIIFAATQKLLLDIEVERILEFESVLFEYIKTKYPEIPEAIASAKVITDETEAKLRRAIEDCKADFQTQGA